MRPKKTQMFSPVIIRLAQACLAPLRSTNYKQSMPVREVLGFHDYNVGK